jgi:hypothetical protein
VALAVVLIQLIVVLLYLVELLFEDEDVVE